MTMELALSIGYPLILIWAGWVTSITRKSMVQIEELHKWHNVPDPNRPGAMAWYDHSADLRTEFTEATREHKEILKEQTILLRKILEKE